MAPADIADRFLGSGKPATTDRINKIARLIDSSDDFAEFLTLIPPDVAAQVQQIATNDRWAQRFGW